MGGVVRALKYNMSICPCSLNDPAALLVTFRELHRISWAERHDEYSAIVALAPYDWFSLRQPTRRFEQADDLKVRLAVRKPVNGDMVVVCRISESEGLFRLLEPVFLPAS